MIQFMRISLILSPNCAKHTQKFVETTKTNLQDQLQVIMQTNTKVIVFHSNRDSKFIGRSTSCSDSYTFTLGTAANSYQPDTAGTYTKVCTDSNGNNVYRQTSNGLYLYALDNGSQKFWFVANRVGGDFKLMGFNFGGLLKHKPSFIDYD